MRFVLLLGVVAAGCGAGGAELTADPPGHPAPARVEPAPAEPAGVLGLPAPLPPAPSAAPKASAATSSGAAPADREAPTIEVSGQLSDSQAKVMRAVAACVHEAASRGEAPRGALDVELLVDASGRVTDIRLTKAYAGELESCARAGLAEVGFPARPEGGAQLFEYPIAEAEIRDAAD